MYRLLLLLSASVLLFTGCATTSPQEAEEVSHSQVLNQNIWNRPASQHEGTLTLVRTSQMTGILCTFRVLVDGVQVAELDNGQKVTLQLFEGQHVITTEMGHDGCGNGFFDYTADVKAGSRRYLLVELDPWDGGMSIKPYQ